VASVRECLPSFGGSRGGRGSPWSTVRGTCLAGSESRRLVVRTHPERDGDDRGSAVGIRLATNRPHLHTNRSPDRRSGRHHRPSSTRRERGRGPKVAAPPRTVSYSAQATTCSSSDPRSVAWHAPHPVPRPARRSAALPGQPSQTPGRHPATSTTRHHPAAPDATPTSSAHERKGLPPPQRSHPKRPSEPILAEPPTAVTARAHEPRRRRARGQPFANLLRAW
jgi:hypothetical protein